MLFSSIVIVPLTVSFSRRVFIYHAIYTTTVKKQNKTKPQNTGVLKAGLKQFTKSQLYFKNFIINKNLWFYL